MNTQKLFENMNRQKELEMISNINGYPMLQTSKAYDEAFNKPLKKEFAWPDCLKN